MYCTVQCPIICTGVEWQGGSTALSYCFLSHHLHVDIAGVTTIVLKRDQVYVSAPQTYECARGERIGLTVTAFESILVLCNISRPSRCKKR